MRSDPKHIKLMMELIRAVQEPITEEQHKKIVDKMKRRQNKPKVTDTRRFRLEDEKIYSPYARTIPMFKGRPLRGKPINIDDIITLRCAFIRSRTLDEFLAKV